MTDELFGEDTPPCKYCGYQCEFKRAGIATGFHVTAWCNHCNRPGTPTRIWYPKSNFHPERIEQMPWIEGAEKGACPICNRIEFLELHHLAPREHFGDDCHLWPTIEVCRACHEHWHERMGRSLRRVREAAE